MRPRPMLGLSRPAVASVRAQRMNEPPGDLTRLIARANEGDAAARDALFRALYGELHRLAASRIRKSGGSITLLDTTSLLHESYLRLAQLDQLPVTDRRHFLAYAARVMRSVTVDFARQRVADRRGGGAETLLLDTEIAESVGNQDDDVIRIHDALEALAQTDERLVRVVELRYFGGLTEAETAEALDLSERTVRRDWEKARLLLLAALS